MFGLERVEAQHHPLDLGTERLAGLLREGGGEIVAGRADENVDLLLVDAKLLGRPPAEDRFMSREAVGEGDRALEEQAAALQLAGEGFDVPLRVVAKVVRSDIRIESDDDVVLDAVGDGPADGVDRLVLPAVIEAERKLIPAKNDIRLYGLIEGLISNRGIVHNAIYFLSPSIKPEILSGIFSILRR